MQFLSDVQPDRAMVAEPLTFLPWVLQHDRGLPALRARLRLPDAAEVWCVRGPASPLPSEASRCSTAFSKVSVLKVPAQSCRGNVRGRNVPSRQSGCAGINDTSAAFIDAQYSQVFTPDDCALREFDAENFSAQMQGRRLLFLGDSLMRGNWLSLVCLLRNQVTVLTAYIACSNHARRLRPPWPDCFAIRSCPHSVQSMQRPSIDNTHELSKHLQRP